MKQRKSMDMDMKRKISIIIKEDEGQQLMMSLETDWTW